MNLSLKLKFIILFLLAVLAGIIGFLLGLSLIQSIIIFVFTSSILGTLLFWDFRVSFVFLGSGILFLIHVINMESFISFASVDVVLFLIGMMIIVGMMKEAGFFLWLVTMFLRFKNLTGQKLFNTIILVSFLLSGIMDEVSSILIMVNIIFSICDFLQVSPIPFLISSIIATNIGSASTVLGNPIGILIAARGGLSFEDFIFKAFPVSFFILIIVLIILSLYYKKYITLLSEKLKPHNQNPVFLYLISIPPDRKTRISIGLFILTIISIAMHRRLENLFSLEENSLLMILPIVFAGIVLIYRNDKARYYIEHEVEWNSLLFFMFLFAQAGVIRVSGIGDFVAKKVLGLVGESKILLSGVVLFSSGILSSCLDNVIVVASYMPIIKGMISDNLNYLWWALLFGGCFGGNITIIGSTANIVAVGILEKQARTKISFMEWIKIGFFVGVVSMILAFIALVFSPVFRI